MSRSAGLALSFLPFVAVPALAQVRSTAAANVPNFESIPVRGLLVHSSGTRLLALNTADGRLEVRDLPSLAYRGSVFTGLEPVAMVEHPTNPDLVLVANHLSDSVSIVHLVDLVIEHTFYVGDEPTDLAVAGGQLFVACSRSPKTGQPTEPPTTYDENVVARFALSAPFAKTGQVKTDSHRPRSLAVDSSGKVYAVSLDSGNNTTLLDVYAAVSLGIEQRTFDPYNPTYALNEVLFKPELVTGTNRWGALTNFTKSIGWAPPDLGRIVFDIEYPNHVVNPPDRDIVAIDSTTMAVTSVTKLVGTTLYDIEWHAPSNTLWVANTEANNRTRFEPQLKGVAHTNRLIWASPGAPFAGASFLFQPPSTSRAMALPFDLEFYQGTLGNLALVAMGGSSAVVVIDSATGTVVREINVPALPVALAVDAPRDRVYVLTLSDASIHEYDLGTGNQVAAVAMAFDPEPQATRTGRVHLYDAGPAASAGATACASCHTFAHMDFLGWDLGNPHGGTMQYAPDIYDATALPYVIVGDPLGNATYPPAAGLTPMKGPMTTQSLRGLRDGEPFHWRGDRRFFQMFRGAFVGLQGGTGVSAGAMQEYAGFVRGIEFPPNPHQNLDRTRTVKQASGDNLFHTVPYTTDTGMLCVNCHESPAAGHFRGDKKIVGFVAQNMFFNVPTLRGIYEKDKLLTGFGTANDGRALDIRDFFNDHVMNDFIDTQVKGDLFAAFSSTQREHVAEFVKAWDTGMAPLVGRAHQVDAAVAANDPWLGWVARAETRAQAGDIDLIVKGWMWSGSVRYRTGFLYAPSGSLAPYLSDHLGARVSRATLSSWAEFSSGEWTFFCVPPGTGRRLGIDHDNDLLTDGDENYLFGTDPDRADPDLDGYWDPQELASSSNPNVFDVSVADSLPPQIVTHSVDDVFVDTATLRVTTNEPTTLQITVQIGTTNLAFASNTLRLQHDVPLSGLPASSIFTCQVVARDRNGNSGPVTSSQAARTAPALFHVEDVVILKDNANVPNLTGTVLIADHLGIPVAGVDVRAVWHSVNNGLTIPAVYDQTATTNGSGVATFTVHHLPASTDTVHFSPMVVGSLSWTNPYFVGFAGASTLPTLQMLYFEPDNKKSYATMVVP